MSSHRIEIVKELRALEQFCTFKAVRSPEEHERFLKDFLADLQDFPFEAVQKACAKWRKSGSTRFPTPGQLIPLVRESVPDQRENVDAWRPLSDDEYRNLSVREKIRHHLILAHDAGLKAGPMWRNPATASMSRPMPGHIAPEAMPDSYRRWKEAQAHHLAETSRLREFLRQPRVAA
jgi:hypothetical protein